MNKNILTADEIKRLVSVEQVLSVYGIEYTGRRIPCPIHSGTDKNFSVQGDMWHCFVCNATGDIFALVQHLSNYDFKQAKDFICDRFGLKGDRPNKEYKKKLVRIDEERAYKSNLKFLRNYQQSRIRETMLALKGTFAEQHLKALLACFEMKKDFFLAHDIHAHLLALLQRYGVYKPMIIIADSQKTNSFPFQKEQYQTAYYEKSRLSFGDYSLQGLENEICIITKSLDEFVAILCDEKPDYWEQAKRFRFCALVLMCSFVDIGQHRYKRQIKQETVIKRLFNLSLKYGINILFCDNEHGAEYTTFNLLENYLFDKQEQLERVLLNSQASRKEDMPCSQ